MNGQARVLSPMKGLLLCGAALVLCACAQAPRGLPGGQTIVDPTSPAAGRINEILAQPGEYPTFADIPARPEDLPSDEQFQAMVQEQESQGADLARQTAPETWYLDASDAFAARAAADAAAGGVQAPTDAEIAESEAFARAMRARANPPPRPR